MNRRLGKVAAGVFAVTVLLGGAAVGAVLWRIDLSVQRNCSVAQQAHPHPGDDVAALVDFMGSPSHSLHERTHRAVWTLGRLGDPKALPALESVYTGQRCWHDQGLCQYELEKAIRRCGGTPAPPRQSKH